MKSKKELTPGFDEIIFENRNKDYGAYVIRKKYRVSTILSIMGGSVLFAALVLLLSLSMPEPVKGDSGTGTIVIAKPDPYMPPPEEFKPELPKELKPEVYRNLAPEIVDTVPEGAFELLPPDMLDTAVNKPVRVEIIPVDDPLPVGGTEPKIHITVEEMPEFPGGNIALMKFINSSIIYPELAISNGIEGKVTVQFVVWTDGSVRKIQVLKGVDPVIDNEAIRVISLLPNWKPGKQNGNPAAVWFTVPVKFELKRN